MGNKKYREEIDSILKNNKLDKKKYKKKEKKSKRGKEEISFTTSKVNLKNMLRNSYTKEYKEQYGIWVDTDITLNVEFDEFGHIVEDYFDDPITYLKSGTTINPGVIKGVSFNRNKTGYFNYPEFEQIEYNLETLYFFFLDSEGPFREIQKKIHDKKEVLNKRFLDLWVVRLPLFNIPIIGLSLIFGIFTSEVVFLSLIIFTLFNLSRIQKRFSDRFGKSAEKKAVKEGRRVLNNMAQNVWDGLRLYDIFDEGKAKPLLLRTANYKNQFVISAYATKDGFIFYEEEKYGKIIDAYEIKNVGIWDSFLGSDPEYFDYHIKLSKLEVVQ